MFLECDADGRQGKRTTLRVVGQWRRGANCSGRAGLLLEKTGELT